MAVNRKLEQFLATRLQTAPGLSGLQFLDTEGDNVVEPPFAVVTVMKAKEMVPKSNVYRCEGLIQIISSIYDTGTEQQALWLAALKPALDAIIANGPVTDNDLVLTFFGIDVGEYDSRDSSIEKAHSDMLSFTAGVSG